MCGANYEWKINGKLYEYENSRKVTTWRDPKAESRLGVSSSSVTTTVFMSAVSSIDGAPVEPRADLTVAVEGDSWATQRVIGSRRGRASPRGTSSQEGLTSQERAISLESRAARPSHCP